MNTKGNKPPRSVDSLSCFDRAGWYSLSFSKIPLTLEHFPKITRCQILHNYLRHVGEKNVRPVIDYFSSREMSDSVTKEVVKDS